MVVRWYRHPQDAGVSCDRLWTNCGPDVDSLWTSLAASQCLCAAAGGPFLRAREAAGSFVLLVTGVTTKHRACGAPNRSLGSPLCNLPTAHDPESVPGPFLGRYAHLAKRA